MPTSTPPRPSPFGQVAIVTTQGPSVLERLGGLMGRKFDFSKEEPLKETIQNLRTHYPNISEGELELVRKSYRLCRERNGDKPRKTVGLRSDHGVLVGLALSAIGCSPLGVMFSHLHDEGEEGHLGPAEVLKKFGNAGPLINKGLTRVTIPRYFADGVWATWNDYKRFKSLPEHLSDAYRMRGKGNLPPEQIEEEYMRLYREIYVPMVYNGGVLVPKLTQEADAQLVLLIVLLKLIDSWHNLHSIDRGSLSDDQIKKMIRKYASHIGFAYVLNTELYIVNMKIIRSHLNLFDERNEADKRALDEIEAALFVKPTLYGWGGAEGVYTPLPDYRLPLTYDTLLRSPPPWYPIVPYHTPHLGRAQAEFMLAIHSEDEEVVFFEDKGEPLEIMKNKLSKRFKYREKHSSEPGVEFVPSILPAAWSKSAILEFPYDNDLSSWHLHSMLKEVYRDHMRPKLVKHPKLAAALGLY